MTSTETGAARYTGEPSMAAASSTRPAAAASAVSAWKIRATKISL